MASFSGGDLRCLPRKRLSLAEFSISDDDDFALDDINGSSDSTEEYGSSSDSDPSDDDVLDSARG